MKKIYEVLKDPKVLIKLRWMANDEGMIVEIQGNRKVITIDPFTHLIEVAVHEALHALHPDWNEQKVLKEEGKICRKLKRRQKNYILELIYRKVAPSTVCKK